MSAEIGNAASFLRLLWGEADHGYLSICLIQNGKVNSRFYDLAIENALFNAAMYCVLAANKNWNSYQTLGLLNEPPLKGRGTESNVIAIPGLWMDIDVTTGNHIKNDLPNSNQEIFDFLDKFGLKPSLIISSGGGLHVYWLFKEPMYLENEIGRRKARSLSNQFQMTLSEIGKNEFGWNLDMTDDLIRLLRVPGTVNFKSNPKPVQILEKSDFRYDPEDFEPYLIAMDSKFPKLIQSNSNKVELNQNLNRIVETCVFLRHCRDNAAILPEPDWFCMIGALCFEGGSRPFIHELSKPYPNYHPEETELKIRNAQDNKSGPILCKTIQEKTGFRCPPGGCGVNTPVHLIRKTRKRIFEFGEFIPEDGNKFDKLENSQDEEEAAATKWPVLDVKALSGIAGEFVELAVRNSEAGPAAVLMTFLCRFGIEVGSGPFLMVGDTKHHARVFGVIVGSSSKARKGTSGKPVKRLFNFEKFAKGDDENTLAYMPARFSPGPLSSGEGLIYAVRDPEEAWKVDNKTGQGEWVTTDPGIDDKRLFILDEEFASALSCTKREGNTLSTIIRGGWDSGDIDPLTKTTKIKATSAHIGICTHITLAELNKKLNDVEAFNGFANRFLWCCAKRKKLVPFPEPMEEKELWPLQLKLIELLKKFKTPFRMILSDEAKGRWEDVYENVSMDHGGLVGNVINRGEAQVMRLSMIYALIDGHDTIELSHLGSALSFWDYCENSAKFIFSGWESNSFNKRLLNALNGKPKSKTELYRIFKNKIQKEKMDEALKELIASGKIESIELKTFRKPKIIYRISC